MPILSIKSNRAIRSWLERFVVQGSVILEAIIDREGRVENLKVLSGHPLLVPAAFEAVQQWRYRPTLLNGQPVEVLTQVTVNFSLGAP